MISASQDLFTLSFISTVKEKSINTLPLLPHYSVFQVNFTQNHNTQAEMQILNYLFSEGNCPKQ